MKIGILTLPLHTNYGGILQAYALQTVLERMGHDVVVFQNCYDGIKLPPIWKMPLLWGKRFLLNKPVFLEQKKKKEIPVVTQSIREFINSYIHTRHVDYLRNIPCAEFDAIVVGSDQIWRRDYARRFWKTEIQDVFLRFTQEINLKRVAYAVSFGKNGWDYTAIETQECAQLAHKFNSISVREDSGVDLCSKHLGVHAEHVIDPTMLLSAKDYIDLMKKTDVPKNDGTLFTYILDRSQEKSQFVNKVAVEREMKPYSITLSTDFSLSIEKRVLPSVEAWLRGFYDAEMVITDSFHGCVFSIIFGKPFIALGNARRGMSRFLSLLKSFGLEDHLLFDVNDYSSEKSYVLPEELDSSISYIQERSLNYLIKALR